MVYFTLYIVTTLATLGCVLNLDKKNWNQIPLIFFIITQMNHDPNYL